MLLKLMGHSTSLRLLCLFKSFLNRNRLVNLFFCLGSFALVLSGTECD